MTARGIKVGAVDIAIVVIISVAVVGVIGWLIYRKLTHKGGCCDCGCSGCTACNKCNKNNK